jgi:hypothetical protein
VPGHDRSSRKLTLPGIGTAEVNNRAWSHRNPGQSGDEAQATSSPVARRPEPGEENTEAGLTYNTEGNRNVTG